MASHCCGNSPWDKVYLALATYSQFTLLEEDFLAEAFDLAGLYNLRSYKSWYPDRLVVSQTVAGLVEMGYGVCDHWRDPYKCEIEDEELSWKHPLATSFTNRSFSVSVAYIIGPHRYGKFNRVVRWDLGHEQWKDNPSDATFWSKIKVVIEDALVSSQQPDLLLLFGEAASNEHFLEAVIQALENFDLADLYVAWRANECDSVYLAARGAAKLGRVWQGSTFGCVERCSDGEDGRPEDDGEGSFVGRNIQV